MKNVTKIRKAYKIIIAGGRDFCNYDRLKATVSTLIAPITDRQIIIVSGTARGADRLGEKFAREYHLKLQRVPVDWETYGKKAGFMRNTVMADYADALIAFWDGQSKGTKNMIEVAHKKGLTVNIVRY